MPDEAVAYHLEGGAPTRETGEFLTDQQLSDMLGITTRTTLRWRRDGNGPPFVRAGLRRVLYRRADVLAWAASRTFSHRAAEAAVARASA